MNNEEIIQLIKNLREEFRKGFPNKSDEERDNMILDIFFEAFCRNQIGRQDLTTLTIAMGHEVNNEVIGQLESEMKGAKNND